jgi:hypothetical protein
MGNPVLRYGHQVGGRRRWPIWVAVAVAVVAAPVAARYAYLSIPSVKDRNTQSRTFTRNMHFMSLAAQLQLYAMHHDGRLPASLEQLVEERYMSSGSFTRVTDDPCPYPVYSFYHWTGPIRFQYRGAGLSMRSHGAVLVYCEDFGDTITYIIHTDGERLRRVDGRVGQ